jgi:hypothetical protein
MQGSGDSLLPAKIEIQVLVFSSEGYSKYISSSPYTNRRLSGEEHGICTLPHQRFEYDVAVNIT